MAYLNDRMRNNLKRETDDLTLSDVEAYERALDIDEESRDDEYTDDNEESNDEDESESNVSLHCQSDPVFSGPYEYTEDVNITEIK